ncbi:M50 family metallopeptidase [Ferruginibacter albus]|uniref:M50 family metallopeptidase n=1 Tax=Ferruginibacter albus TaxID=2875540 RepID=UPI001CC3841D|nr:M50 family metallopeptidase [Ferruginibacter albus]UAY53358.1 M50 family metallopeptidase [Ferruginibacter albus]
MGLFTLTTLLTLVIAIFFVTLLHELGHAIPALIFTKKPVEIYLGSYGDKKQSISLTIGRLSIWLRYIPLKWRGGLCIAETKNLSTFQQIIYILGGPLFSLIIAVLFCWWAFYEDQHGAIKLICLFIAVVSLISFISNLIPHRIKGVDRALSSDGHKLSLLLKKRRLRSELAEAAECYDRKEYEKAGTLFESFIDKRFEDAAVYRYAIAAFINCKNYKKAYDISKQFEGIYKLVSDDYYTIGLTCLYLKLEEERVNYFKRSLELNPDNAYTLNAMGYVLNTQNKFDEAILFFDRSIAIQPEFSHALNNRGHAKLEKGQLEEGLKDIQHSLTLDKENSYTYRNLGIYHLLKGEKETALQYFYQSKELDKDTELIEELIAKAS